MDYREQEQFLKNYGRRALAPAAGVVGAGAIAAVFSPGEKAAASAIFLAATLALAYAVVYNPKYLLLTIDEEKKYAWAVRIRWIGCAAVLLLGWLTAGARWEVALAAGWMAAVNAGAAARGKRGWSASGRLLPGLWTAGDFVVLAAAAYWGAGTMWVAALAGMAAHLAIVLAAEGRGYGGAAAGLGALLVGVTAWHTESGAAPAGALYVSAAGGTWWLAASVVERNRANVSAAIAQLTAFSGKTADEVRELLLTASDRLAERWNESPPATSDREELARWYLENSFYYVFASTAFQLQYKQIAFNLDVLAMARGRCLDYGAGPGHLVLELARRGQPATYFDVAGKTMEFARWQAEREGLTAEFRSTRDELRGREGYDTVISLDALEHMPDLEGELTFLASLVKPAGRMIFNVPTGETESHPMHLSHEVDVAAHLERLGLVNAKTLRRRWLGSEILRKRGVYVFASRVA